MNIAIIGYGKMGKVIEKLALERGHHITVKINSSNIGDFNKQYLTGTDVAIEFSTPEVGYENVKHLIDWGIPTVSGTTGWKDKLRDINILAKQKETGFIYASNFSLGVNLFFALNEYLAVLMNDKAYNVSVEEIHHTSKKDSPSGTAITLAEQIISNSSYMSWVNNDSDQNKTIPIVSKRENPAPGTHTISYKSSIDTINIQHIAHSREGFALGAILAAEWIIGKTGVHTMKEVLGITTPQ